MNFDKQTSFLVFLGLRKQCQTFLKSSALDGGMWHPEMKISQINFLSLSYAQNVSRCHASEQYYFVLGCINVDFTFEIT